MSKDLVELTFEGIDVKAPEGKIAVPDGRPIAVMLRPGMSQKEETASLMEFASEFSGAYLRGNSINDTHTVQFYRLEQDPNYAGRLREIHREMTEQADECEKVAVRKRNACMYPDATYNDGISKGINEYSGKLREAFPEIEFEGGKDVHRQA